LTPTLLDSDTLSEILRGRNAYVTTKAVDYLAIHGAFTFSAFTRYEIRRGYSLKNSARALARFEQICSNSLVIPVTDAILDRTSELWVEARRGGHSSGDADLIIAATALEYGYTLASGNTRHYDWIATLTVENWRLP
jgi:tRNA(fMet)-specific endonuclease VapC